MNFINNSKNLIVQKYGGATLATPEKIKSAAQRIFQLHQSGTQVVVVVSAMGKTTNDLIALAQKVSDRPQLRELDMLLTVGERISMSLMSMALNDLGCPAISFTGSQAGILTDEAHVNANIIDVKAFRVEEALLENKVVIMAGFQGVSPVTKEITTLGRGGSDTSAVAMAGYLKADRCEILKDVDGVYTADPKLVAKAQSISDLNYKHLLEMTSWGAQVLHHRSVEMAQKQNVKLYVGPAAENLKQGTVITSDFEFKNQKAIAVNSYQKVFELKSNHEFQFIMSFLTQNQIAKPQLLLSQENSFFIAGPIEILNSIEKFESQQDFFEIKNKSISSVSVTFAKTTSDDEQQQCENLLTEKNINFHISFKMMNSLHFLIEDKNRIEAIQCLHSMIV